MLTNSSKDAVIIRKELQRHSTSEGSADHEQRILAFLNCLKHPNIVELLGSYTLGQTHNLLFPLADGDLAHFLTLPQEDIEQMGFRSTTDFLLALCGLASAINALHSYELDDLALIGCHHDLKPGNVLVSNNKLILADFGLSTFKRTEQGSKTYFKVGQGYYFAPECEELEDDFKKSPINRASDIWSLGCMIVEIAIFMLNGAAAVLQFKQDRKVVFDEWFMTYTFHYGRRPNPGVERWLNSLSMESPDEGVTALIELVRSMLQLQPAERPKAAAVLSRLRFISLQHIYAGLTAQYQELYQLDRMIDISIERERFDCWAWGIGLVPGLDVEPESRQLVFENESKFSQITVVFSTMGQELDAAIRTRESLRSICMPLRRLNDAIVTVLPDKIMQQVRTRVELQLLTSDSFAHLGDLRNTLETEPQYKRLEMLAAIRSMHILSSGILDQVDQSLILDKTALRNWRNFRTNETATLISNNGAEGEEVLIEWMIYEEAQTGEILLRRAGAIARFLCKGMKPSSFLTLRCRGFLHDIPRHAFAMVYDISSLSEPSTPQPVSLHELIEKTDNVRFRPLLNEVFALARRLATALLEYHKVNWLHKNISSHNIIFRDIDPLAVAIVDSPYIIGFNLSRPDHPTEISRGPEDNPDFVNYQDPRYRDGRARYKTEFDYFSLGLVLLEIGMWKTLHQLIGPQEKLPIRMIRKQYLPLLGPRMGKSYRDAVSACLSFEVNSDIPENGPAGQEQSNAAKLQFERDVLEVLGRCSS